MHVHVTVQVSLDPSGLYAAASSADKSVVLFDIFSGECVTKLYGHSGAAHVHDCTVIVGEGGYSSVCVCVCVCVCEN